MAGTVVGVFKDHFEAEQGAQALLENGVPLEDITIVAKDAGGETGAVSEGNTPEEHNNEYLSTGVREVSEHDIEQPVNTADEAVARGVVGLVIGATLGSLVTALLIYFPYFEPIFMAHPLMSQLVGAAVGAAMVPISYGTDTGGSIRGPAALCGIAGIKPTYGLVSRAGVAPAAFSLDHIGPMAWTAEDCAIMLQTLVGHDPADPASADQPTIALEYRSIANAT